jgi:N-acyl-D-amino-acid deacylase
MSNPEDCFSRTGRRSEGFGRSTGPGRLAQHLTPRPVRAILNTVEYDIVLSGGRVLDGCGSPWFWGDVGIQEGRVVAVSAPGRLHGRRHFSMDGRFVAPGFVDIHTHSDLSILINRRAESVVRQGVTTEVIGNCGMSPAPVAGDRLAEMRTYWGTIAGQPEVTWEWRTFGGYLEALERDGLAINLSSLLGHGAVRIAVMGFDERAPTPPELARMEALVEEAMRAGACGLSTGLVYPPGCFASTDEIVALCRVAARHGGLYASHIRGERETVLEAVAEAIHIGREAGLPVQISHNAPKFGAPCDASVTLRLVDEARAQGLDVTVDNDVHTDLGPALVDGLPQEIQSCSSAQIVALLRGSESRRRIREEIVLDRRPAFGPVGLLKHGRWERITILHAPGSPGAAGKTLAALAQERGQDPFDVFFDLILESGTDTEAIWDYIDEANIRLLLRHPNVMICSDGGVLAPYGFLNDPPPYAPCSYGEFPGVLERYVRDEPLLTLEEAIRKMTSFPARRVGLYDRGILRPGARADVVVFDLDRIHDRATNLYPHAFPFENYPHRYPEGIDYVFVNGILVVDGQEHTGALPGHVLRHTVLPSPLPQGG